VESSITYTLGANIENLTLTDTADINGTGNGLVNVMTGNSGNNQLDGAGGIDSYAGGDGDDTYVVDNTAETVTEAALGGTDLVQSSADYTLSANVENLTLLTGGLVGTGNAENNEVTGNSGNNTLYGLAGTDTLTGGSGDDQLYGGSENDVLIAGSNNDLLDGGTGADDMQGGSGNDTYVVDDAGDTATDTSGTDLVQASVSHVLSANIENLDLTGTGNIDGTGNALVNTINGNSGNNRIDGQGGADVMNGGDGNDTYVVDNAGDSVTDTSGTDWVESSITHSLGADIENLQLTGTDNINGTGNGGVNTILGNSGNNLLNGLGGIDTYAGGAGDDTYVVNNINETVTENGSEGTDLVQSFVNHTLSANVENLTLVGAGNVNATGNGDANVLTGNTGNNVLDGAGGADQMAGGDGNDTYVVDDAGDTVTESSPAGGTDLVQSSVSFTLGANVENLTLVGGGNIDGTGNADANTITANGGNNRLDGQGGIDNMAAGGGDDTYVVDQTGDVVTEGASAGTDLVESSATYTLSANVENLTLTGAGNINGTGNGLDNTITGNTGNNRLDGLGGADSMSAGAGDDTYVVDNAGDTVSDTSGTDTVESSISYALGADIENLTLTNGAAIDGTGNAGVNTIIGNSNKNLIDGGAGADNMSGLGGNDTYVVDDAGDIVTEGASAGIDQVQSSISYTLTANVENLVLTGTDNLSGTGNTLVNTITGNSGNNLIDGGAGNDNMIGGLGDDTYVVSNVNDDVIENADEGTDLVQSTANYTLSANVENLTLLGAGNRNGTGNGGDNVLTGNSGSNVLSGLGGADTLHGNGGNDTLDGGDGTDTATYTGTITTSMVTFGGGGWTVTTGGGEGTDTLTDVEIIDGAGAARILLVGNGGFDSLADALTAANDGDTIMLAAGTFTGDATISKSVTILGAKQGIDGGDGARSAAAGTGESTLLGHFKITASGAVTIDGVRFLNDATTTGGGASNPTLQIANGGGHTVTNSLFYSAVVGGGVDDRAIATTTGVDAGSITITDNYLTGASAFGFSTASWGRGVWFDGGNGVALIVTGNTFEYVRTGINIDMTGTATAQIALNSFITNGTAISGGVDLDGVTITDNDMQDVGTEFNFRNITTDVTFDADVAINTIVPSTPAQEAVVVLGGSGNDDLFGTEGVDVLDGNNLLVNNVDHDELYGRGGADTLLGRAGNDLLDGGAGIDSMTGGIGDDTYVVDDSSDTVTENASEGTDLVQSSVTYTLSANLENLTLTGAGNIDGTGNAQVNTIIGNTGANRIDGGIGQDFMSGGDGDDTYVVDHTSDTVTEASGVGTGTDLVEASASFTLSANIENLTLLGGDNINGGGNGLDNVITGNTGNNILDGQTGIDTMAGGLGDDTYVVESTGDVVTEAASEGTDLVQSSAASYTLSANVENLELQGLGLNGTGNADANTITGNAFNNTIDGAGGADTMIGGLGNDTYVVDDAGDTVTEGVGEGTADTVNSSINYTLGANVENLTLIGTATDGTGNELNNVIAGNGEANTLDGAGGLDTLIGGAGVDVLTGGTGDDNLQGGSENDVLIGGSDNDTLDGGTGADQMFGGTGNDTYTVDDAGDFVSESSGQGTDTVHSTLASYTLTNNVENLVLDTGAGNGTGNASGNAITGNADANDIDGKAGNDTLAGGLGADNFVFSTTLNAATNVDSITDFSVADDSFNLKQSIFTTLSAGTLDAGAFVTGTVAGDADDRIVYDNTTGDLFYDADGNGVGGQVKFANVTAGTALTNNDFIIS
jgi:Ca2+-binding RTX toxin-like protein